MPAMNGTDTAAAEALVDKAPLLVGAAALELPRAGMIGLDDRYHIPHKGAGGLPRALIGLGPVPRIERRPVAVLLADVAGYSRLIEADDLVTALRVRSMQRHLIEPAVDAHGGRIVDRAGDGVLMAFPTATDAVLCAVQVQQGLDAAESVIPESQRLRLRMGVSADEEVLVIDGDLYGRAVNVAARLAALAEPGDVLVSGKVFDIVSDDLATQCQPLGRRRLRNIAKPVRVYRIVMPV